MATQAGTCTGKRRMEVGSTTPQTVLGTGSPTRSGRRAWRMRAPREGRGKRERTALTRHSPTSALATTCRVALRMARLARLTPSAVDGSAVDSPHLPMVEPRRPTLPVVHAGAVVTEPL